MQASARAIPDEECWNAWSPAELASRLAGIHRPWCVVGGWALDLWHGFETRDHDDLEFTILRDDFAAFRQALAGMDLYTVEDGVIAFLPPGASPPASTFQIWCHDVGRQCWRADMMIEPGTPETWIYKRDNAITRPRSEMVALSGRGVPYLRPPAILLFKAKHIRPKDELDFSNAIPRLDPADRKWLRDCLVRLHPGHAWIERL